MRVRISTNPPLPSLKAWFPLDQERTSTISSLKFLLSTSIPVFRGSAPSSLRLSIDGFELLDNSELCVVRDGDLICVGVQEMCSSDSTAAGQSKSRAVKAPSVVGHKRKRRVSTSTSGFESDTESTTSSESEPDTETSDSDSDSDSDDSSRPTLQKPEPQKAHGKERVQAALLVQPKPSATHPATLVPPGYGKPQTRSRNLRRRRKRMYEREATDGSEGGPETGPNAILPDENTQIQATALDGSQDGYAMPVLPSLSLRNKNKARNFRSFMSKPLPPKIIFRDEEGDYSTGAMATPETVTPAGCVSKSQTPPTQAIPRLIPPSSRTSLPPNVFVTSIDVGAGMCGGKKKHKMRVNYGEEVTEEHEDISLDYGNATETQPTSEADVDRLELIAENNWATLERPARAKQVSPGTIIGYKALGINPVTCTPEQMLTVGSVVWCDNEAVVVRTLRGREQVSFSGPADDREPAQEEERHTWDEIIDADWRILT